MTLYVHYVHYRILKSINQIERQKFLKQCVLHFVLYIYIIYMMILDRRSWYRWLYHTVPNHKPQWANREAGNCNRECQYPVTKSPVNTHGVRPRWTQLQHNAGIWSKKRRLIDIKQLSIVCTQATGGWKTIHLWITKTKLFFKCLTTVCDCQCPAHDPDPQCCEDCVRNL